MPEFVLPFTVPERSLKYFFKNPEAAHYAERWQTGMASIIFLSLYSKHATPHSAQYVLKKTSFKGEDKSKLI